MRPAAAVVLAAVLGIVAGAGVTYAFLHNDEPPPSTVSVVVSTEDMPAGHRIAADELRIIQVPEDEVVPGGANTLEQVIGQEVGFPIYQNQQIPFAALVCKKRFGCVP